MVLVKRPRNMGFDANAARFLDFGTQKLDRLVGLVVAT
jgi:hypothetical protein